MKKFILDNFSHAMLPKSATRLIAGGAYCQVIDCGARKCTPSDNGRTECCGNDTGKDCYHKSLISQGPSVDMGYSVGGYN